MYFNALSSITL